MLGHSSKITDFCLSKDKDFLYSIAEDDNALFEWQIDFDLENTNENCNEKLQVDHELVDREIALCATQRKIKS